MALYDNAAVRRTISPAVRTNGTVNGVAVDLGPSGADSLIVAFVTGTVTDGTHTAAVQESDNGTSGWAAVASDRLTGTVPAIGPTDDDTLFEVGVRPSKQYVRASVTTTGATTGGAFAAVIVAGEPGQTPISRA